LGDPELCAQVLVDGRILLVNRNSSIALRNMRKPEVICRMWIDSICIDQTHLEERAQQVILMGRVYQNGCWNTVSLGDVDGQLTKG
jgi:hypothetical protein